MAFIGLKPKQRKQLELEVVPKRARLQLTRLLRRATDSTDHNAHIARMNNVINVARNVLGLPISLIEMDDMGDYHYVDSGWIRAELEVCLRRPDTPDLVETIADLIGDGWLELDTVNEILHESGCGVSFKEAYSSQEVIVSVLSVEEIESDEDKAEIPNIRLLASRMDGALEAKDYSAVLHASASIFETLAKDVIGIPTIENQTLASFFERYRTDSNLPTPVLDYILEVYKRRNVEPLAGHGQTKEPTITEGEAVILAQMTKAFVRIERQLEMTGGSLPGRPVPRPAATTAASDPSVASAAPAVVAPPTTSALPPAQTAAAPAQVAAASSLQKARKQGR